MIDMPHSDRGGGNRYGKKKRGITFNNGSFGSSCFDRLLCDVQLVWFVVYYVSKSEQEFEVTVI